MFIHNALLFINLYVIYFPKKRTANVQLILQFPISTNIYG